MGLTACQDHNVVANDQMNDTPIQMTQIESENKEIVEETVEEVIEDETPTFSQEGEESMLYLRVGDQVLEATFADNSSAEALKSLLEENEITISMRDYGNMEKVGSLPQSLPKNDTSITTEAGDLILYQGNQFVIYYDTNAWNFTSLGKINNITGKDLKAILGNGDVSVTLFLKDN